MTPPDLPRLAPELPLPPYSYIPDRLPHPIRDPRGHMYGRPPQPPTPLDPARWQECRTYLHGIDLFNHGYYWEAHEVWEGPWRLAGRETTLGQFLQGLIKLAAAGVKVRQGMPAGVAQLAAGAAEHFRRVAETCGVDAVYLGLRIADLLVYCGRAGALSGAARAGDSTAVLRVFDFVLQPSSS